MVDNRTDRRGGRWRRLVAAPVGAVALVGLAACGTSSGTSTDPSTGSGSSAAAAGSTGTPATSQDAAGGDTKRAAFRSCLAQNGVTLPERRGGGGTPPQGGTPPSGAPAAPGDGGQGGGGQGGGGQGGGGHGGGAGRTPGQAPPGVDATTWAAARKACADLAPSPPAGAAAPAS